MQIISDKKIETLRNFIYAHDFFYIAGHKDPDGDCVYSCLAFSKLIESLGKEFQLVNAGPFKKSEISDKAEFFTNIPQFLSEPERKKSALIMLDCSEIKRLGELEEDLSSLDTFIIDHHKTSQETENSIIDSSSPATCSIVQQIFEKMPVEIDKTVAEYIFFGQATDTNYFKFLDESSEEVFLQTARLVKCGVNPRKIHDKITGGHPYSTRKLLGVLFTRAEKYFNGKLVITWETLEDTKKYGLNGRDSDALYTLFLSTEGVEAVVFARQDTEYTCTAGFRSKDKIDVSTVAQKFGGGGHKNAAGMSVQGKLENIIPAIQKEFARILENKNS